MGTFKMILLWTACVLVGAVVGFLAGFVAWQLGFALLGSAIALIGAGVGGIAAFLGILAWSESRDRPRRADA
jgi:hypothetical protein